MSISIAQPLPIPAHFDPERVGQVWRVPYDQRAVEAKAWAGQHGIRPANADAFTVCLFGVDLQNTFCIPDFELYVGGRLGTGAVDDNRRLVQFIYRNLPLLTEIALTMDTHRALQIFHPVFLVDEQGNHPGPVTQVTMEDVRSGRWRFNPEAAPCLGVTPEYGQAHLEHYVAELHEREKYDLTIWPYHAMLGGIGHALVSAIEEVVFFHTIARNCQADIIVKGDNPLSESYSAVGPEVATGAQGEPLGAKSGALLDKVQRFDRLIIAGQAKSHCVAWTIDDLLEDIRQADERLVEKIYLLEDCTSPVVVPGVVDYTEPADAAYARFAAAGMHVVRSTDPLSGWPGMLPG